MAYIYQIQNDINGKLYIGKTEFSIEKRFKEHCKDAFRERCEKRPLYMAMRKYGIEHFHISLIEETNNPEEREKFWIECLGTFKNGYNATIGGDGKAYIDYDLVNKVYSQNFCIIDTAKELGISADSVKHILEIYGIKTKTSAEVNLKKSGKAIKMKDEKGVIQKIFPSQGQAAKYLIEKGKTIMTSIDKVSSNISRCANGKRKTAYGYLWEYV